MLHIDSSVHLHQLDCSRWTGALAFPTSEVAEISRLLSFDWGEPTYHFAGTPSTIEGSDPLPEKVTRKGAPAARKNPDCSDAFGVGCSEQQAHRSTFGETEKSRAI
jgi:hypothetical protein